VRFAGKILEFLNCFQLNLKADIFLASADKKTEKEKEPEQKHQEKRRDHSQKTADIRPRFLIPSIRRGTMGAKLFFGKKRSLAGFANFQFHKVKNSKKAVQKSPQKIVIRKIYQLFSHLSPMTFRSDRDNLFVLSNNIYQQEYITHLWLKNSRSTIRKNAAKSGKTAKSAGSKS
jgi:hypothetical protein